MSPNTEKIHSLVTASDLPGDVKAKFTERLQNEGATKEVVEAIKQAIRSSHAKGLLSLQSILEMKDPAVKAANKKFAQELRAAKEKFMGELQQIEKEAEMLQNDVKGDLARLEELVVASVNEEAK